MEVQEKEMEQNLLQKAEAFGYLYKEHQKEIRATIQKRDENLGEIHFYTNLFLENSKVHIHYIILTRTCKEMTITPFFFPYVSVDIRSLIMSFRNFIYGLFLHFLYLKS